MTARHVDLLESGRSEVRVNFLSIQFLLLQTANQETVDSLQICVTSFRSLNKKCELKVPTSTE